MQDVAMSLGFLLVWAIALYTTLPVIWSVLFKYFDIKDYYLIGFALSWATLIIYWFN